QWHGARDFTRPHSLGPQLLVGRCTEADRWLLHHLLGFSGHPISAQTERLTEGIQLRKDDVAGLTAGLILSRERGHRVSGRRDRQKSEGDECRSCDGSKRLG